jgi:dephospho-CoA kinase
LGNSPINPMGQIHSYQYSELKGKLVVGLTGEIGCGKSYIAKRFAEVVGNLPFTHIDCDSVAHRLLETNEDLKAKLVEKFGTCTRKGLGALVFQGDEGNREILNRTIFPFLEQETKRTIDESNGLILVDGALIIEASFFEKFCNCQTVIVLTPPDKQVFNLLKRGYGIENATSRVAAQLSTTRKILEATRIIESRGKGFVDYVHNYRGDEDIQIKKLITKYYDVIYG